ncbi:MAG: MotA/TolQ/ExbB proton channel family protein [candidate division Zixibacteria bacterium]|nr:MotA/TolQ/ExbB proton channel family protein [candidate division Zixibacteria bacterium]
MIITVSGSIWQIVGESSAFGAFILGILIFMSLISWAVIIHKWRQFRGVEADTVRFQKQFTRTKQLSDSIGQAKACPRSPLSRLYLAGYEEAVSIYEQKTGGNQQRQRVPLDSADFEIVEMAMEKTLVEEVGLLERRVIFLATTASAAPFLGLLGTVVGIMDAFWSIGARGSASLAVVAPGIAEALLATIVGLGAAIPAVMAYNWANNKTKYLNDVAYAFILDFISRAKKEQL